MRPSQALRDLSRLPPAAIFACFILAGALVALDLVISSRYGLLARPPMQDGVNYMAGAKMLYYTVTCWIHEPSFLGTLPSNWALLHAPLWVTMMSASFFVLGEGEWQSHLVRIWPLFLLLLLIFWFVRRRWHSAGAWFAVGITATLPTVLPALAACARGWATEANYETYYLGDPRPDLLAAVLLVWAVVLILDNIEWPRRLYFVCSGLAVGLACLTKPSGMPAFIMIWSLVWVYFVAVNARNLGRAAAGCALSLASAAAIVIPYLWLGGYQHITEYVWDALVAHNALWSKASSPLGELAYYWIWFDRHLGMAGWSLLILGLSAAVISLCRRVPVDRATLSYLAIAAAFYLLVAVNKTKNEFFALPFYLFLCLFSWAAIAGASQRWLTKTGVVLCVVMLTLGTLLDVAGAAPFLVRNLHKPPPVIGRNREVLRQIALDLKGYLKPGETFTAGDWYFYTAAIVPYYSISDDGMLPYGEMWLPQQNPGTIAEFINDRVAETKVALLWKQDMAEVREKGWPGACRPEAYDYYRALHGWINRPGSPYLLVKEYTLYFPIFSASGEAGEETLTLQLYAKTR